MTTIKNFLNKLETSYKNNAGIKRWNSVSPPFIYWPSIDNEDEWNKEPILKLKRLDMWKSFANTMKEIGIKNSIDIGGASGQFTLIQRLNGIESYCVDPQLQFLHSNTDDFKNYGIETDCLYLGDLENFIKLAEDSDIQIDCISFLNFIHGWNGTDQECLNLMKAAAKLSTYILTSHPQNQPNTLKFIQENMESIAMYEQIDKPRENHFLLKIKK